MNGHECEVRGCMVIATKVGGESNGILMCANHAKEDAYGAPTRILNQYPSGDEGGEGLSEAEVGAITQDDMRFWLSNQFMDADTLVGKVCWWINAVLADRLAAVQAEADMWKRQAEGFLRAATNDLGRYHREREARESAEAALDAARRETVLIEEEWKSEARRLSAQRDTAVTDRLQAETELREYINWLPDGRPIEKIRADLVALLPQREEWKP